MTPVTTRFAPSPTGYLHLGHALAAYTAWQAARRSGGRFLLRLEDIDQTRCRPEYASAILEDLRWLGLDWDGPVRVQSEHFADYQAALDRLAARGLIYSCFCTRADIERAASADHAPDGTPLYPGTCRDLSDAERLARVAAGERYALRFRTQALPGLTWREQGRIIDCHPERFGDIVIARKDTPASYHLCVTHDDALQGVTLVTRGIDLQHATHVQRAIQAALGWPAPDYAHHALMLDEDGRRYAKRDRSLTLRALREGGVAPQDILRRVASVQL